MEQYGTAAREHYRELLEKCGFASPQVMQIYDVSLRRTHEEPEQASIMLRSLAGGDIDGFVREASKLGISGTQARHAVRDTAALAALVMQLGEEACW